MLVHLPHILKEPSTVYVTSTFTSGLCIIAIHILKRIGRLPNNSCLSCLMLLRERIFCWLSFRLESTKKSPRKTATLYLIYWSSVTRLPNSCQIEVHKSSEVVSMSHTYSLKVMEITHSCSFHNTWDFLCYSNETQHFHFTTQTHIFKNSDHIPCPWKNEKRTEETEETSPLFLKKLYDMWQPTSC